MNSKDIWNIVLKIKRCTIKINASVFFFLVIPTFFYYNTGAINQIANFLAFFILPLFIYSILFILINISSHKAFTIYPFGIQENKSVKKNNKVFFNKKVLLSFIYCILMICYLRFFKANFDAIFYPIMLFFTTLFSRVFFENKYINFQKKVQLVVFTSVLFLVSNLLAQIICFNFIELKLKFYIYVNTEQLIILLSFINFILHKENIGEFEEIAKHYHVKEIMTSREFLKTLSPTDNVENIIDEIVKLPQKVFPVLVNNKIVGIVKKDEILLHFKASLPCDYPIIEEIMTQVKFELSPESNVLVAKKLFERAHAFTSYCIPVVKDGRFLGLLFYELFLEFISVKKFLNKLKFND